jgi:hypothetical protein
MEDVPSVYSCIYLPYSKGRIRVADRKPGFQTHVTLIMLGVLPFPKHDVQV